MAFFVLYPQKYKQGACQLPIASPLILIIEKAFCCAEIPESDLEIGFEHKRKFSCMICGTHLRLALISDQWICQSCNALPGRVLLTSGFTDCPETDTGVYGCIKLPIPHP